MPGSGWSVAVGCSLLLKRWPKIEVLELLDSDRSDSTSASRSRSDPQLWIRKAPRSDEGSFSASANSWRIRSLRSGVIYHLKRLPDSAAVSAPLRSHGGWLRDHMITLGQPQGGPPCPAILATPSDTSTGLRRTIWNTRNSTCRPTHGSFRPCSLLHAEYPARKGNRERGGLHYWVGSREQRWKSIRSRAR